MYYITCQLVTVSLTTCLFLKQNCQGHISQQVQWAGLGWISEKWALRSFLVGRKATVIRLPESADFLCRSSQVTRLLAPKVTDVMWPQPSSCGGVEEQRRQGWGSSAEEKRTEEEETLPLTGPMYIISEARMKRERVRKRKTGKSGGEEQWEQTKSSGQI